MSLLHILLWMIVIVIAIFAVYAPLAELLFHVWHIGTVYRGDELTPDITLTFDDGPHPEYTPALLEWLAEMDAKAVFFIVGERAVRYPALVRAIHEAGHVVGSHTYHHNNGWFMSPWRSKREIAETGRILQEITGEPVRFFRPPWGRFHILLPRLLRNAGQTPVLWTFATRDWSSRTTARMIAERIGAKAQCGAIVLLHDSGGAEGAPRNTLSALRVVMPYLKDIGMRFTVRPVTEAATATRRRKGEFPRVSQRIIHPVWQLWERVFDRWFHVYPMTRMFRLSIVPWRFGTRHIPSPNVIAMPVGAVPAAPFVAAGTSTIVAQDAPMVEVHLQNLALQDLMRIDSPEKMAIRGLREVRDSLHQVAKALVYDDRFRDGRGIFGMTLLNRGMDKLGFHIEDVEQTLANRWVSVLLRSIMMLYHPHGRKRMQEGLQEMRPRLMWMTREELLARYVPEGVPANPPTLAERLQEAGL